LIKGKEYEYIDKLPWHYKDTSIEVALTGKAFNLILENKNDHPYILHSVLAKANVYARMGPDDKANLVENL
jgi:magnesium-transporting ATPase (P-type)